MAAIGTVFFSTLARSGFTAAIRECLMIELGVAAVLFVLARALPRRPRDAQTAETEPTTADTHAGIGTGSTGRTDDPWTPNRPTVPEPVFPSQRSTTRSGLS